MPSIFGQLHEQRRNEEKTAAQQEPNYNKPFQRYVGRDETNRRASNFSPRPGSLNPAGENQEELLGGQRRLARMKAQAQQEALKQQWQQQQGQPGTSQSSGEISFGGQPGNNGGINPGGNSFPGSPINPAPQIQGQQQGIIGSLIGQAVPQGGQNGIQQGLLNGIATLGTPQPVPQAPAPMGQSYSDVVNRGGGGVIPGGMQPQTIPGALQPFPAPPVMRNRAFTPSIYGNPFQQ